MGSFKNLKLRIRTALFMATAFITLLVLSSLSDYSQIIMGAVALFIVCASSLEFADASASEESVFTEARSLYVFLLSLPSFVLFLSFAVYGAHRTVAPLVLLLTVFGLFLFLIMCFFVLVVVRGRSSLAGARRTFEEFTPGVLLLGCGGCALTAVCLMPENWIWLTVLAVSVCFNDIGAYFIGSRFGKNKLSEHLSPAKTIEGSAGGLFFGVAGGFLTLYVLGAGEGLVWLVCLLFMSVCAQLGDLGMSYFKRILSVKDLGNIFPGHGGLIDRLDGVFATSPILLFSIILNNFIY